MSKGTHIRRGRTYWYALIALCLITLVGQHFAHLHPHFEIEERIYGFLAWLALFTGIGLVIIAKLLRPLICIEDDHKRTK